MTDLTPEMALAVTQLYGQYADAIHRLDAEAWGDTWCSDAKWELPLDGMPPLEGRDTIVATWSSVMPGFKVVQHMPFAPLLKVENGVLCARWTVREQLVKQDGEGEELLGIYDDTHREEDGKLRYQTRRFKVLYRRALTPTDFEIMEHPGPF
ncbi:MAG: nuclear transport factor 2 family protein [Pseudomonadota bacterium]